MGHTMLQIQRLATLFQSVESGELQVPAYQRPFSWGSEQVLRLMQSVYRGYPIGTLVFWRSSEKTFETASADSTKLPDVSNKRSVTEGFPVTYVIDGVQRLSSLYNCLRWQEVNKPSMFNIVFDLDLKVLVHFKENALPRNYVHLSSVFSPTVFTQERHFRDSSNFQGFLEEITNLRAGFIDYEISITTLADYNADEIYTIFELLNSTGVRLTRKEILKARAKRAGQNT